MKKIVLALALMFSLRPMCSLAQTVSFVDYSNYHLTDIAKRGLKKEKLFLEMNRELIKVDNSICSNRALVWVYDLKRFHQVDAGKIFLFHTPKSGKLGRSNWWYHVAPVVNENSRLWILDGGFPGVINGPLTQEQWFTKFTGSNRCKAIKGSETDLIQLFFKSRQFPETTPYGTHDCYYKYVPAGYWTPASIAMNLLGVNQFGEPVHHVRDEIEIEEVYQACVEAVTTPVGRWIGNGDHRCRKYLKHLH